MNRSLVPSLAFLTSLFVLPTTASAQERIELSSTPDLSVIEAAIPLGKRWKRQRSGKGTSAAWALGAGIGSSTGAKSGGVGAGTLALGWRSPDLIIGARSELTGFIPAEGEGLELAKTRGRHRATAVAHLTERRDDYGVHLALDGWARHSGGQPFRLDRPRYGTAPLKTFGGDLGLVLRMGDDDFAGAVPVNYRTEETRWDSGALAAARSHSLGMALGMQPGEREAVRGTIQLLRANVEHTRFERRAAFGSNPSGDNIAGAGQIADEFRKVTLGGGFDRITMFDRKVHGTFDLFVGWSWLESDVGDQTIRENALDFRAGTNFHVGKPGDSSRIGFAIERDPNRSADGSRVISEWRVELSSDYEHGKLDLGVRGGLSWLSSKAGGDGSSTPTLLRYGTQLEGFYKLPLSFQVGGYVGSSFEPQKTFDPWAADRSWNTEAGLLLRWKRPAVRSEKSYGVCGFSQRPPEKRPVQLHRAN